MGKLGIRIGDSVVDETGFAGVVTDLYDLPIFDRVEVGKIAFDKDLSEEQKKEKIISMTTIVSMATVAVPKHEREMAKPCEVKNLKAL